VAKPAKKEATPLVQAAQALEEELQQMGSIAREAQRLPLNSRRNLERTAESLGELGTIDARLEPFVKRLLSAVSELVSEQQAQAATLQARAEELQRRRAAYAVLLERYSGLGRDAQELNGLLQKITGDGQGPSAEPVSLDEVQESISRLIANASATAEAAAQEDFEELARDAEALRQRLLSARNKLGLLAQQRPDRAALN
jgi:hypothetical protein